jgi:hypothetical protein
MSTPPPSIDTKPAQRNLAGERAMIYMALLVLALAVIIAIAAVWPSGGGSSQLEKDAITQCNHAVFVKAPGLLNPDAKPTTEHVNDAIVVRGVIMVDRSPRKYVCGYVAGAEPAVEFVKQ